MKLSLPVLAAVLAAGLPLSACAQQSNAQENGPPGPPPEVRAQMQKARDDAKTAAFNDLSAADRAKVQSVIDQLNNGQLTDLRAAAQQIDAALTPAEQKAVLGERDKMMQTMRANMPAGAPGGPPPEGRGGERRGAMRNDAGFFLLQVSVSREKMRELHQKQAPPPQQ